MNLIKIYKSKPLQALNNYKDFPLEILKIKVKLLILFNNKIPN